MRHSKTENRTRTIRQQMFFIISGTVIFFAALAAFSIICSMRIVGDKAEQEIRNTLDIYMKNVNERFSKIDMALFTIVDSNPNYQDMYYVKDSFAFERSKMALQTELNSIESIMDKKFTLFCFYPEKDTYFWSVTGKYDIFFRNVLSSRIRTYLLEQNEKANSYSHRNEWFLLRVGNEPCLVHAYRNEGAFVGAWIPVSELVQGIDGADFGNGSIVTFLKRQEEASPEPLANLGLLEEKKIRFNRSSLGGGYLVVESSADFGSYTLAIVVPKVSLFRELIQIGLITAALTLLCLLALGIALRSSREQIINPLKKLSLNMREFSKGNLQVRTEEKSGVAEIHELETIFNTMTKEIKALKIDTYEKQLLVRDVRYKYLQVQIRPHFYINMLNLIYGLAQVNQNETIQTLAIATSDYLRYILGSEDRLIPLSRELEGVRNYMKIQQIRYRDRIRYEIAQEADDRCPVPPLLIQTFLENAVKHNITVHPVLCITVRLRASGTPEHPYLSISVTDNGAGFPEDLAERLNHRKEPPHGGEKIGIMNIVNRMELLFDTDFSFEIHNLPPETEEAAASGASVQIRIPARTDDEGLMPPV